MTYKLEPGLARIISPVRLVMKDEVREYRDGKEAADDLFNKKWKVTEIRAAEEKIEVVVEEMNVPVVDAIGEETFF